ncbi:EAL and GGDEF domain-containing protein [Geosporobacter ferrireducens]|uniref:Diguanylate cyclase n=1 Tax=Geosporobacter ferrireducens TaxID=1424294 RepID=A0A1D8GMJ5_9FIRM|nr:bifunctional diguanylate cyclase/phosphodiesterase [Geosporobacter ferrireducens]AOT72151.1 hypothetical protein Gferi_22980 [Geosporobacter ferrireducens]MTI56039.1 EAL domain-containing protein [Geosporobacter ferrireducens]
MDERMGDFDKGPITVLKWKPGKTKTIAYISPNMMQYGYRSEDIIQERITFCSIIHPDDLDRVQRNQQQFMLSNQDYLQQEYRICTAAGEIRWIHSLTVIVKEKDESTCHCEEYLVDITARKNAEIALKEAEAKYRSIVDGSFVGIYIIQNGLFSYVNVQMADIFGYTKEEMLFKAVREIVSPEDYGLVWENIRKRIEGEIESIQYQFKGVKKDKSIIYIKVLGSKILYKGSPAVIGTLIDITESKRNDEQLRMAAKVFENTIEGVVVTDIEGTIQWVNPAFSKITGYSESEAIGKNPRILKSQRHDDKFYREMWKDLKRKGQWQGEIWNRRKNGETYPEWLTISAIKDESGKTIQYVSVFNDITERIKREEHIKYQAYHDALTGLPNRSLLYDRLSIAIAHAHRSGKMIAVMMLDLDRFKRINDTLGHPVGDILLQEVGRRLVNCLREGDTVSRLGGDEFAVILEDIHSVESVIKVAQKILRKMDKPVRIKAHDLHISTSIGISLYPADGQDVDTLLKHADTAMFQAKQGGRNQHRLYTPKMNDKALQRLAMENELRKALEREEFLIYYQPKLDLSSGRVVGAEALVRWKHPQLGFLSPVEFIPLAEETGLIKPLGDFVLRTACLQNKRWQDSGVKKICISVNLSAVQFQQKNLLHKVTNCLSEVGLDPCYLELEITESSAIQNPQLTIKVLKEFKRLGIQLSIDDFGTGYSSLGLLNQLPLDKLKIDKSFIKDITSDKDNQAIVSAIIAMSRNLGIKVVAEGVETIDQMLYLKNHQCDQIQGYLISPPIPAEDFEKFLIHNYHEETFLVY